MSKNNFHNNSNHYGNTGNYSCSPNENYYNSTSRQGRLGRSYNQHRNNHGRNMMETDHLNTRYGEMQLVRSRYNRNRSQKRSASVPPRHNYVHKKDEKRNYVTRRNERNSLSPTMRNRNTKLHFLKSRIENVSYDINREDKHYPERENDNSLNVSGPGFSSGCSSRHVKTTQEDSPGYENSNPATELDLIPILNSEDTMLEENLKYQGMVAEAALKCHACGIIFSFDIQATQHVKTKSHMFNLKKLYKKLTNIDVSTSEEQRLACQIVSHDERFFMDPQTESDSDK